MNENKIYYWRGNETSKEHILTELSLAKSDADDYVNDLLNNKKINKELAEDIKHNMYLLFDKVAHLLAPEFGYGNIKAMKTKPPQNN